MDTHERFLFRDAARPPSLRGFLPKCRLEFAEADFSVDAYPIVKIYEDGIVLLSFRVLSDGKPWESAAFTSKQINLFAHRASAVWLPPAVLGAYAMARAPENLSQV